MSTYTLISSDSHIIEPADLWETRIDRTFHDRAPRLVRAGEVDQWYADGVKFGNIGTNQQAGLRFEAPDKLTAGGSMNTIPLGGVDPHAHVKDMDVDGVVGGVLYPSQGLTVYRVPDSELLSAIFRAYNDRGAKLDARDQHTQPCGRRPVCGCTGTTHQCGVHRNGIKLTQVATH